MGDVFVDNGIIDFAGLYQVQEIFIGIMLDLGDINVYIQRILYLLQNLFIRGGAFGNINRFPVLLSHIFDGLAIFVLHEYFPGLEKRFTETELFIPFRGLGQTDG